MQISDWYDTPWTDFFENQNPKAKIPPTGIDLDDIKTICTAVSTPPEDIEVHKQVIIEKGKNRVLKIRERDTLR